MIYGNCALVTRPYIATMDEYSLFERVAVALAAGILIGIERGWHGRAEAEGSRVAGIRTFGLIGLLGGVWMLIADHVGDVALGLAFAAFALVVLVSHVVAAQTRHDFGATTAVAALLTFALGALAVSGEVDLAAAGAVITAMLLGLKAVMHRWLERISYEELMAVLKLLVMSVVLLPVLPNRGYGPWHALNPFELWWMVVLIAALSFLGYAAARLFGPRRGILLTAACGGLTSSTALAISFSRFAAQQPQRRALFASGVVLASTIMFPRVLVIVGIVDPALSARLLWPLVGATVGGLGLVALLLRIRGSSASDEGGDKYVIRNPFELGMALKFGVLLAAIAIAVRALHAWAGDAGVYALGAAAGLADVDAISLSLARITSHDAELLPTTAAAGILIAVLSNTLSKSVIAVVLGRWQMAPYMAAAVAAMLVGAAAGYGVGLVLPVTPPL